MNNKVGRYDMQVSKELIGGNREINVSRMVEIPDGRYIEASEVDGLIEAVKSLSDFYRNIWDRADGAIFLMPERVDDFEVIAEKASQAIARFAK